MSTNPASHFACETRTALDRQLAQEPPDSDLWRRFKLGDEQAAAALYDRYSQLIYNVAHQVLQNRATSEDVLQEVFFQLWRVPDIFDPAKGSLRAWLTVVSRRRAIDRLRERKSEIDVFALVVPVKPTQLAEAALKQITNRVSALLNDMPPKLRVTFRLAFMEGLTHAEISQRLGDPLGTTKSRIRQALCLIRKKLNSNTKITKGDGHV